MPVADDSDNRRRDQWSHTFDGSDASAIRSTLDCNLNSAVSSGDLLVQLRQFLIEALKQLPAKAGQLVLGIFQHCGQTTTHLPGMLRQHDPILSQQAADLVDQLGAATDKPAAHSM